MSLTCTVAGVSRTVGWAQQTDLTIRDALGERKTLDLQFQNPDVISGYRVPRRATVAIADGAAPLFGGIVDAPNEHGPGQLLQGAMTATGYEVYLDWRLVTWHADAGLTLKQAFQYLIATPLAPYAFTLDAAQVDGPTLPALDFVRVPASEVVRQLMATAAAIMADGKDWICEVSAAKVIRAYAVGTAGFDTPWVISDATPHLLDKPSPEVTDPEDTYFDRVIAVCGDARKASKSQTFVRSAGTVDGNYVYFATDYPCSQDQGDAYPSGITVPANPGFTGPCWWGEANKTTKTWSWDFALHRVIFNKALGGDLTSTDTFDVPYTAQYPFEVISDAGSSTPKECVITLANVLNKAAGQALADAARAQLQAASRRLAGSTHDAGLIPGQVMRGMQLSKRGFATPVDMLVMVVEAHLLGPALWRYDFVLVEGYLKKGAGIDFWRGGGATTMAIVGGTAVVGTNEIPPGMMAWHPFGVDKSSFGYLKADGSDVVAATYPRLIPEGYPTHTVGGVLMLALPDMRGVGPVGVGTGTAAVGTRGGSLTHHHAGGTPVITAHPENTDLSVSVVVATGVANLYTLTDSIKSAADGRDVTVITSDMDTGHGHDGSYGHVTVPAKSHAVTSVGDTDNNSDVQAHFAGNWWIKY